MPFSDNSVHLQGIDISYMFKKTMNWGRGRELFIIIKQSCSQCVPGALIPYFGRVFRELVMAIISGQDQQTTVAWQVICPEGLCCFSGVVSDTLS